MRLIDTPLESPKIIEFESHQDERGSFSRLFCCKELSFFDLKQVNLSKNPLAGTLRGLHFQVSPHEEGKIVGCLQGEIFDVIVDMRPHSAHFGKHFSLNLTPGKALYIPPGFAHGFISLIDHTDLIYFMSGHYTPEAARGIVWNDPSLNIQWPREPRIISSRDSHLPSFKEIYE